MLSLGGKDLTYHHYNTIISVAIEQMKREKAELEANCTRVEQQLSNLQEDNRTRHEELQRELERKRRQQMDLEKHLESLEKQRKKLSVTRVEVSAQVCKTVCFQSSVLCS